MLSASSRISDESQSISRPPTPWYYTFGMNGGIVDILPPATIIPVIYTICLLCLCFSTFLLLSSLSFCVFSKICELRFKRSSYHSHHKMHNNTLSYLNFVPFIPPLLLVSRTTPSLPVLQDCIIGTRNIYLKPWQPMHESSPLQ